MATAVDPHLVKSLYIARPGELLRLNPETEIFEPDVWPGAMAGIGDWLSGRGTGAAAAIQADVVLLSSGRRFPGARGTDPGNPVERENENPWIIAELDRGVIVEHVLPRLVARHFRDYEGRDYRVAVMASRAGAETRPIFTSGNEWTTEDLRSPDYATDLLAPFPPSRRGGGASGAGAGQRGGRGSERGRGEARGPLVLLAGQNWGMLVKHPEGSVETAVTKFRRRNMAISFGILVVLGASAVALVISSSRARRLGRLQMEFAAGISHELRTPLAVIQSAAHNLGSGVVQDREGIAEYASIVKGEARRLTEMVEQVMAYTETQSGRKNYDLVPVDVRDVTEMAIRNMTGVLSEGNARVTVDIAENLPPALADAPALVRCLQNLLSNAVKYGREEDGSQIEVQARYLVETESAGKVQITVDDHGPGVPESDVKYLFEPFHRGSNATTNTPGNGLGLHLVDRIMQAQRGSVTYDRNVNGGARFTLTLQAAPNPA
jgi:signal transduction histidine kinase